uniref:Peptidase S1 domain-containing protein n=1 Tax=Caenorhabditis tropicalis TaxID=1561998 RepID=A0A1I7TJ16_9PELO
MDLFIIVRGGDRTELVRVEDGTVNEDTLRGAFQLKQEVPIGLFKSKVALKRRRQGNDFVFELKTEWFSAEFEIKWEEESPSRSFEPNEKDAPPSKKQKTEPELEEFPVNADLAASLSRYAYYYEKIDNCKRNVIPLGPRFAVIHWSNEIKSIEKVKIDNFFELVYLKSKGANLCDDKLVGMDSRLPKEGMQYFMMGFSIAPDKTSYHSLSTGTILCQDPAEDFYMGSSCSFEGGGSCWDKNGKLIGMLGDVGRLQEMLDDRAKPLSPPAGARCVIFSALVLFLAARELLAPDSISDDSFDADENKDSDDDDEDVDQNK